MLTRITSGAPALRGQMPVKEPGLRGASLTTPRTVDALLQFMFGRGDQASPERAPDGVQSADGFAVVSGLAAVQVAEGAGIPFHVGDAPLLAGAEQLQNDLYEKGAGRDELPGGSRGAFAKSMSLTCPRITKQNEV